MTVVLATMACVPDALIPGATLPTLDDSAPSDGFVAVSAGFEHTCGLKANGAAYCWGSHEFGQLGAPADATCSREDRAIDCRVRPVLVTGGHLFQKISAGGRITCGLTVAGAIYCWGDNLRGGIGDPALRGSETPVQIASTALFSDVAAGGQHGCGLRTDGVLFCWGSNDMGQVGSGGTSSGATVPTPVNTALRFVSVAASDRRTCARQSDGALFCWGMHWVSTQGGFETTRPQLTPSRAQSQAAPLFTSFTVGVSATCGITPDNGAYCWEANPAGGIGDGSTTGSTLPRRVLGDSRFVAISSGGQQTCGIADDGLAHCWGLASLGQLGISPVLLVSKCGTGGVACSPMPVRVNGWRQFAGISAGQGNHACALTIGGNIYCWGAGGMGQRGDGKAISWDWLPSKTLSPAAL